MTEKRYSLLYGIDENPYEWDIIDNEKNSIIYQSNGIAICNELNELNDKLRKCVRQLEKENKELKEQLKDCTKKAKEEIRKQKAENAIRWANIGR